MTKITYQPYELLSLRHSKRFNIYIRDLQPHTHHTQVRYHHTNNIHNFYCNHPIPIPPWKHPRFIPRPIPYGYPPLPPPVNIYLPIIKIEPGMSIPQGGIQIYINSPPLKHAPAPMPRPVRPPTRPPRKSLYSAKYASYTKQFIPSGNRTLPDIAEESISSSSSDCIVELMNDITTTTEKIDKIWYYLNLEIHPEPISDDLTPSYNNLKIDLITWRLFIATALNKLHGLIGESLPYDIIATPTDKSIIIRIYHDDLDKFITGLMSYTFNLGKHTPIDINCYIKVVKRGEFIGLVATHDHISSEIKYFDDSTNLLSLHGTTLSISFNDGKSFEAIKSISDPVIFFQMDPYNRNRAFAFTRSETHYVSEDKGKNWRKFKAKFDDQSAAYPQVSFNAANPDYLLVSSFVCPPMEPFSFRCKQTYYYTKDGFKTTTKLSLDNSHVCKFVKSTTSFKSASDSTILCISNQLNSFGHVMKSQLYKSDDFFKSKSEITLGQQKTSELGVILDLKIDETFAVAIVNLDKFNEKSQVNLYVSKDGSNFNKADVQIDVKYGVMSFLPSSPSSLFFQILQYSNDHFQASTFYSSDSSGLHFRNNLEQIAGGNIQKVENIDGAWLANIGTDSKTKQEDKPKSMFDALVGGIFSKDIITKYSFNNGQEWSLLKSNDADCDFNSGCSVHLWEYSELDGEGKFITGPTPGILMGVGNTGTQLDKDFQNSKTFISRDGGASWNKALDFPSIFSFGDQGNIILAIPFMGKVNLKPAESIHYSLDQGKSWNKVDLKTPIYPLVVLTTIDGTSKNFLVIGAESTQRGSKEILYTINFAKAFDGNTCKEDSFEEVYARQVGENNPPLCIYGHREKFTRRKQDANCLVNKLFEDVKVIEEPCQCTEVDFECAMGFKVSDKDQHICVPDQTQLVKMCKDKKQLKLDDKVMIDGNKCDLGKKKLSDFIVNESIDCSKYTGENNKQQSIVVHVNEFEGELVQYSYIDEKSGASDNIVLKTTDNHMYVSNNGGVDFVKVPIPDKVLGYYTGPIPGQVILVTVESIYVSHDAGLTFTRQKVPAPPHPRTARIVSFHATNKDKFIWFGRDPACDSTSECPITAYITDDSGLNFFKLPSTNVQTCDFVGAIFTNPIEDLIYCAEMTSERTKRLVSLTAGSNDGPKVVFPHIVGYAITGNFLVVATVNQKENSKPALEAKVTVDGSVFADADFPHDFQIDTQQAYTILDSKTKAIFMHVTTNIEPSSEYGAILKSNSNGTSYALVLDAVNRNGQGYVDYDRIDDGLEGLIISNVVANVKEKSRKKLQTMISHNDGGEWTFLQPPATDSNGKKYDCKACHLHLHGFTERADYRDTYSSGSATGFLIGVGNVGEYLEDYDKSSTFMSKDAGVTWREIKQGNYMWEYGDRGTILVLVSSKEETDTLLYSLDEGDSWIEYKFSDKKVKVLDLATVPTDTSRKFVIFAKDGSSTLAYSIDFTNIHARQCQLDLDNPDKDDYEYWSPINPNTDDVNEPRCLFGHEAQYLRRAKGHHDCFIGSAPLKDGFKLVRNCTCTRRDYECDYNYSRDINDNTCKLVQGLTPEDKKKEMCAKPNAFEYYVSTGYRKIAISTCQGGKQFDNWNPMPCPGKQREFNHHYGTEVTGHKLFLVLFVPLVIFFGVAWFVYDRGIRRNGGFKRLGQIRLDDDENGFDPIENNQVDVIVNRVVKGGIFITALTIASIKTIIKIDKMIFEKMTSVFLGRAPGRRNYVNIPDEFDDEEAALFGDYEDDDEELQDDTRSEPPTFTDDPVEEQEQPQQRPDERLFDIESEDEVPVVTP
ncbi:Vacuolar protein sorting/targeting protein 10 [Spathaspora sp. JA1]|nr:Vacuolar protein sorting/targeting protein 10 [Spathaspora sp. JA1]